MIVYFNLRPYGYRETVDQIERLVSEYHMAGMSVYLSSRRCKNWKD